jgi:hypothetical protein
MQEIKFNRNYKKLHNQTSAELTCIWIKLGADLHKDFIEYDTDGKYEIDKNKEYLVLWLIGDKLIPFTTLRKLNKENANKYVLGERYKIVVEEQK